MLYNTNDGRFFSARARRAKTSNLIVYDFSRDSKITPDGFVNYTSNTTN